MSTGTTNGRDRYRFDEDELDEVDSALRDAAVEAETVDGCAFAAADALGRDDPTRLRIRAYQLALYEPDWPSHVTREQVQRVAREVETIREAAEELRLSRTRTKRALRWAGVADAVERTTMLSVLERVKNGDLGEDGGAD